VSVVSDVSECGGSVSDVSECGECVSDVSECGECENECSATTHTHTTLAQTTPRDHAKYLHTTLALNLANFCNHAPRGAVC
jgi:hypothetical protein